MHDKKVLPMLKAAIFVRQRDFFALAGAPKTFQLSKYAREQWRRVEKLWGPQGIAVVQYDCGGTEECVGFLSPSHDPNSRAELRLLGGFSILCAAENVKKMLHLRPFTCLAPLFGKHKFNLLHVPRVIFRKTFAPSRLRRTWHGVK